MNEAEIAAQKADRRIVKFTNIDNESFTHSYHGLSITVKKGSGFTGRFPEADHLATHLARKIIARQRKGKTQGALWKQGEIDALKLKMIADIGNEDSPEVITPQEERTADLKKIKKDFEPVEVTKREVIADLKKRGAKVDITKTKDALLAQLMELEAVK